MWNARDYPYLNDILAQPAAVEATADGLAGQSVPDFLKLAVERGRRVVLTGMGSSFFALLPLYRRLLEANASVTLIESGEMLLGSLHRQPGNVIVAVSQSGESVEIVRLLERKHEEVAVLGITNTAGSSLDRLATASILMAAGPEATVSTKTYLASLLTVGWLGDRLLGGTTEFSAAADAVAAYLAGWQDHVEQMIDLAKGLGNLFLVGRGDSAASAGVGALIVKESVQLPAEGLSGGAFRHGPLEMAAEAGTAIFVFGGSGEGAALNARLIDDITAMGGRAVSISPVSGPGRGPFSLPEVPVEWLPIVEILPIQLLTLAVGEARGAKAGQFHHMAKITTVE